MKALQLNPDDPTGYLALGQYGRILSAYLTLFPRTQLLILFSEDLEKQAERLCWMPLSGTWELTLGSPQVI